MTRKLSEKALLERDAKRDLNAELLESIAQMKTGKVGRVSLVLRAGQVVAARGAANPAARGVEGVGLLTRKR